MASQRMARSASGFYGRGAFALRMFGRWEVLMQPRCKGSYLPAALRGALGKALLAQPRITSWGAAARGTGQRRKGRLSEGEIANERSKPLGSDDV